MEKATSHGLEGGEEPKMMSHHIEDAKEATNKEHSLTLRESFKAYRCAVFWSACISLSCVMEGYDYNLISSLYAFPPFQEKYGVPLENDGYTITANWQLGVSIAANGGMIIGGYCAGYLVEYTGYRKLFIGAYCFLTGFIFIPFFAPSIEVLFAGELLCGLCWGVFSGLAAAYGSEILPAALRTYLLMFVNMCWAIGNIISAGTLYGFVGNQTEWAYRVPFAIQWVWNIPLALLVYFAPESPWWLIRKDRLEEAEKTAGRLGDKNMGVDAKSTVAMMVHTNELERQMDTGTSYWHCFKGVDRRRTEIACMAWLAQAATQFGIPGYLTYFFQLAGLPVSASYKLNIGQTAIGLFANMVGQVNGRFFGRRTLYLWGLGAVGVEFFLVGFCSFAETNASRWVQAVILLLWSFTYSSTIGPTGYLLPSEISATRLRAKTVSMGRNIFYVLFIISMAVSPYMLNETEGNWKGKAAFVTAGFSVFWWVWAFFRLPESKGRTYEELDILFANRVPARDFSKFEVDPYADEEHVLRLNTSTRVNKLTKLFRRSN
ncbi:hypothetical protein TRICI_002305 [Trichomonascus ciferrii]|uniref:Major facilitator superfamily (MFS) profile domain-containing protein n=1 Tax=Trichomonascus ciferrii TaxID=44093 RepID=A0A642V682_9ASCO|nr:hypothetical protein TRICI_002305 [Trichomonascus ciferrii]